MSSFWFLTRFTVVPSAVASSAFSVTSGSPAATVITYSPFTIAPCCAAKHVPTAHRTAIPNANKFFIGVSFLRVNCAIFNLVFPYVPVCTQVYHNLFAATSHGLI